MLSYVNNNQGWLMIIYRVPSIPSTSRVTVWKKVKGLGAFFLQQSVYILPDLPVTKEAVALLKEQVQHLGGECKILEVPSLGEEQEKETVIGFNKNREEEYTEVFKACKELSQEIDEESKTEDFHYADLEENEKHLQRVRELLDNVVKRDYFGSDFREKATRMVNECEEKFGAFSHEVYAREGVVTDDKKPAVKADTGIKYGQEKVCSKNELIKMMREIVNGLNRDDLIIGEEKVATLSEPVALEWDYRESKEAKTIEIRINWLTK